MVIYCALLHTWWGILLLLDGKSAVGATAVDALYRLLGSSTVLAFWLFGVAALSITGLFYSGMQLVSMLLPQQITLMASAAGALMAIILGQFADGVVRPRVFIAADQVYIIFAMLGHTVATLIYWSQHRR